MPNNHSEVEKRLWDSADELWANSTLKSSGYSVPVRGLIFFREFPPRHRGGKSHT